MTPVVGVDWGEKRIGLAVSDPSQTLARALPTAVVDGFRSATRAVARVAAAEGAEEIVLGLPLLPSGDEGESARRVRKLGAALAARGYLVHYRDEALTSEAARDLLAQRGDTRPAPGRVDAVAATLILQEFLDARAAGRSAPAGDHA